MNKYLSIIFATVLTPLLLNFLLVFTTFKIFPYSKHTILTLLPTSITPPLPIQLSQQFPPTHTITLLFIIT
ncbi:LrgB family protein, partial [Staphylococcus capitis]|uniref:LrgB family protein n=1 Tax=Staphylococcus capitis TaxID=29388 RepID=UPI003709761C